MQYLCVSFRFPFIKFHSKCNYNGFYRIRCTNEHALLLLYLEEKKWRNLFINILETGNIIFLILALLCYQKNKKIANVHHFHTNETLCLNI